MLSASVQSSQFRQVLARVIALLLMLPIFARSSQSQGITLPSVRVGGPSPEVRKLLQLLEDSRLWYDSTSNDAATRTKFKMLSSLRLRYATAPFTDSQLKELGGSPTSDRQWLALYRGRLRGQDLVTFGEVLRLAAEFTNQQQDPHVSEESKNRQFAFTFSGDSTRQEGDETKEVRAIDEQATIIIAEPLLTRERDEILRGRLDTLSRIARLVVIERELATRHLAPVRGHEQAAVFWQQQGVSPLNLGSVSGGGNNGAAHTELASPLLHAIRVSLNAIVAGAKESSPSPASAIIGARAAGRLYAADDASGSPPSSETALTRFVDGGGLFNLALAWPAWHKGASNGAIDGMLLVAPRISGTLPALGASARDSTLFVDGGVELHLRSTDIADGVGLFSQLRFSEAAGTKNFGDLMGVLGGKNHFAYIQFAAGFLLGGKYLVTAGRTLSGPRSLRNLAWQVGVTVIRGGQEVSAASP
jgi:hypothetical protein